MVEVLSRRLGGSSEETTHHDGRSTQAESLGDVSNVADTTIGPGGNTEPLGKLRDGVDGSTLGSTDGHDLLSDADRSRTHTDSETVGTGSNEGRSLLSGDDVASNDVDVGESLLDPLDHLDLEGGVTLARVEDDDIKTSLDEESETVSVGGSGTDGGSAVKLLGRGLLGCERVVLVLEQIRSGEERDEVTLRVNEWELALSRISKKSVGVLEGDADLGDDKIGNHNLRERGVKVSELDVSASDDSDELAANLAGLSDGDAAETKLGLDVENAGDEMGKIYKECIKIADRLRPSSMRQQASSKEPILTTEQWQWGRGQRGPR